MEVNREAWKIAQAGELGWHIENQWRANDDLFIADTKMMMRAFGFTPGDYKSVVDIGAGPRLRSRFFHKAKLCAIEPLAEKYIEAFDWCDLKKYKTYPVPIESFIDSLHVEFAMSINVLDHCQSFDKAISNISRYADHFFLSYDCGDKTPDSLHPLQLTEEISDEAFTKYGLKVVKQTISEPYRKGHAVNYWLEK